MVCIKGAQYQTREGCREMNEKLTVTSSITVKDVVAGGGFICLIALSTLMRLNLGKKKV